MNLENIMPSERSQSLGMVYQHDSIRMKGPEKTFMETENRRLLRDDWWGSWRWWLKDGKFLWGTWEIFSKRSWWWMRFLQRCWTSWWAAGVEIAFQQSCSKPKEAKLTGLWKPLPQPVQAFTPLYSWGDLWGKCPVLEIQRETKQ